MHPDLSFLIFAIPRQPLITLSMTKGERLATGVLSSLEVMIQKRGQLVDVRVFVAEVGLVSVSSSDTNGDPSFFLLILLCRFPDGKEPGAAAGEEEFEVAMVMFKFFAARAPHPPWSPTRGHPDMGQSPACRGAKDTRAVYSDTKRPHWCNTNSAPYKISPSHLPIKGLDQP